jgi:hypothetical protein
MTVFQTLVLRALSLILETLFIQTRESAHAGLYIRHLDALAKLEVAIDNVIGEER